MELKLRGHVTDWLEDGVTVTKPSAQRSIVVGG
jgi:hypothetical protein